MASVRQTSSKRNHSSLAGRVLPFRRSERRNPLRRLNLSFSTAVAAASLAAFTAVFVWDGATPALSAPLSFLAASDDTLAAKFKACSGQDRTTCVVDGDTFWYRGEKIRIADFNTPETFEARCSAERARGEAAKRRLIELLNAGSFNLESVDRDRDKYGRALRVVTRGGQSIGVSMIDEGLAEPWRGRRSDWCAMLAAR
ncbi:MAG: thermonuclease family protein [Novosphingobium sp.]